MELLHAIRCRIRWHRRGPLTGDTAGGAYRQCLYCGSRKTARAKGQMTIEQTKEAIDRQEPPQSGARGGGGHL
jgi:hypothetical protein